MFAWVSTLIFIAVRYGPVIGTSAGSIAFFALVGLVIAIRFLMYRLKVQSEVGFGMGRELAREVRFLIPLILFLVVIYAIQLNLAGIFDIVKFTLFMNIPAVVFRVASYRLSDRFINDTAPKRTVELIKERREI